MEKMNKSYYAIIPANVRYDKDLPPNAKLLYGEITALCNERGYCWAENKYFAELYNVSKTSISKWISALTEKGYIQSKLTYKEGSKEIDKRYITIVNDPIKEKLNTSLTNINDPIKEKLKDNNTSNNTINNTSNKKKERKKSTYDDIINSKIDDDELKELICEFIKMRNLKKKPLTDRALTMQINKLLKLSSNLDEQKAIVEKTVVKCWDEFYPLKEENKGSVSNYGNKRIYEPTFRENEEEQKGSAIYL